MAIDSVQAISFDAYGTLLHLERPVENLQAELRRHSLQVPVEAVTDALKHEILFYRDHHLEGCDPNKLLDLRHRCAEELFAALAANGYASDFSRKHKIDILTAFIRIKAYDEAQAVLRWCRNHGLPTAVVSNWDCSLESILKAICPEHRFDVLVVSACKGVAKPDPALFHQAAQQLGLDPANIVHIGDEFDNDFQAARNAGFQALLIERHKEKRKQAECSLISLSEIPDFLRHHSRVKKET